MANYLSKNEIAQILGIPKSTIRYYEQIGLIHPVIDENKYRQYHIDDLKKLSQIHFMRDLDFDIESIRSILEGTHENTESLLKDRQKNIKEIIHELESQLHHIDSILKFSEQYHEKKHFEIQEYPDRYLYELQLKTGALSDLYKHNQTFFGTHNMRIGDWFVNTIDSNTLLTPNNLSNSQIAFVECIEVNQHHKRSQLSQTYHIAKAGRYLSLNLILDEHSKLNWLNVSQDIVDYIKSNEITTRPGSALILNKDNLNFNFEENTRILNIQIPIK